MGNFRDYSAQHYNPLNLKNWQNLENIGKLCPYMQIKQEKITSTSIKLTVAADQAEMDQAKQTAIESLGKNAKLPGFRAGKAPAAILEKSLDPSSLQNEFLNEAVNQVYGGVLDQVNLKIVDQPKITITKFVPFTQLEFTAEVEVIGDIKLADYKKIKLTPQKATTSAKEVDDVIKSLAERSAEKKIVQRAAKLGDEVTIDFKGVDAKTKEAIKGADGQDYGLTLGSKAFIPGFEEELVGLKPKDSKTFDITFPENYSAADLQKRRVTFSITVQKVNELKLPKLDDAFAASVGPFKTLSELEKDIKTQLTKEKQRELDQKLENDLMQKIADKTDVDIPESLIEHEVNRLEDEEKRDLVYRGQTWQEHLDASGVTIEQHREQEKPVAKLRIKTGLILGEIADKENITVSDNELNLRVNLLKGQYQDEKMQAELDSPEGRRDIRSRLLVEKTLDFLKQQAVAK